MYALSLVMYPWSQLSSLSLDRDHEPILSPSVSVVLTLQCFKAWLQRRLWVRVPYKSSREEDVTGGVFPALQKVITGVGPVRSSDRDIFLIKCHRCSWRCKGRLLQ